ncbi:TMEM175 family protein [Zwartia sp.]|uniref:TMEM175 family protein n=1 Tax=Zwartia sp. TaxID=2978004 RepID=UPI0027175041|nr:TMEM175 family protein [Zwartia sp.]MDO9023624.1 TMEM175 family protein [Zwartia sp.]
MTRESDTHAIGISKQRLEALSDGVYSVALTLLVLDLKLPVKSYSGSNEALLEALYGLLPNLLTWLLSFYVLTIYWLAQARLYRLTKEVDPFMVRAAFAELALISLLPFSTSLIGEHGSHIAAAAIYSLNLLGIATLSLTRTTHVLNHPLLHENHLPTSLDRNLRLAVWIRLWCSIATLGLAFLYPGWNMFAMLPVALLPYFLRHAHR